MTNSRPIHESVTTKEGWTAFVNQSAAKPRLQSRAAWAALSPVEREVYDEQRIEHHARLVVVATPTVNQIVNTGAGSRCSTVGRARHGVG